MENKLREYEALGSTKIGFLVCAALLACAAIFALGCEEVQKTGTGGLGATKAVDINDLTMQAYKIILDSLGDKDPAIRTNAIEVVAQTGQIKLIPKVQRLFADEFAPVRFAAAMAIGDLEYSFGAGTVKELFKDEDSNVKLAACYAMVKLGSAKYLEVLRRAIGSSDQTVRANVAFLLGKCGDKDALKLLYWAMQDKDSADKVIYQAAESIAMLGDDRIYPKLWTMLLSVYADVRVCGVRSMGALGTREARNALLSMLDDKVPEVRLAAAEQLGRLRDTTGEPEVLDVFTSKLTAGLDERGRERVNVMTAMAIGRLATPSLTKHLPKLIGDESKAVRIAAARAVLESRMKN
jgi:HEAT repeat protein